MAMMMLRRPALVGAAMIVNTRWPACRAGRGALCAARAQVGGRVLVWGARRSCRCSAISGVRLRILGAAAGPALHPSRAQYAVQSGCCVA